METRIDLDMLNQNSVSVKTQRYLLENGQELLVGQPHRRAYVNSVQGREQLAAEVTEPYLSAILAVWGDTATVDDPAVNMPQERPAEQ